MLLLSKTSTSTRIALLLLAFSLASIVPAFGQDEEKETTDNPVVVIKTTMGDIVVELFPERAPESVANFLAYVDSGFYKGTIFHRVIKGFMIQGGGFNAAMQRLKTREPIHNEARNGLRNRRGTLAMARVRAIHSATSQFFINLSDNRRLDNKGPTPDDYGYAVFGQVIEGMEAVHAIETVKTTKKAGMSDVPQVPVVIIGAERRTGGAETPGSESGKARGR